MASLRAVLLFAGLVAALVAVFAPCAADAKLSSPPSDLQIGVKKKIPAEECKTKSSAG
ncbi:MAG: hypothetical protein BJ554DRAFT_4008 [Olpidium bornovanus]|uniref:Uncharacterized protein n=1 Tax=Olpidium bornovanus TaxID=278681 RepID=A0A8H8DF88_9FUNG|nr:MAG: hypothetical protein BJ554DRAFT_4008 [Olpidium bornovanus]